jgi:deazaflavin-dependent oxidoreductase (nitroreductase family)
MPLPRGLAEFNRGVTNRIAGLFAGRLPPFVLLEHRGRHSGRRYTTPLMVFRRPDGYQIALTYGPDADWVRNVLGEGGCTVVRGGRRERMMGARVERGTAWRETLPAPVRFVLTKGNIDACLVLESGSNRGEGRE